MTVKNCLCLTFGQLHFKILFEILPPLFCHLPSTQIIFIFYVIVSRKTNICTLKKAIHNKADIVTDYQNQINQTDYIQLENLE